jgi:hypothetical protein
MGRILDWLFTEVIILALAEQSARNLTQRQASRKAFVWLVTPVAPAFGDIPANFGTAQITANPATEEALSYLLRQSRTEEIS